RRPEEAVAGDPPLGLPGLRGLLREGPGDRRGRAQGLAERDRSQAAGPLILPRPAPAGRAFCARRAAGTVRSAAAPPSPPGRAGPARPDRMTQNPRFPAEWEPQSAILIAWPHAGTDWAERLGEVEETYIALVAAITRFQDAWICVADDDVETYAEARLRSARIDMERVRFIPFDYDDTWLRDSGPITLREGDGFRVLDFR